MILSREYNIDADSTWNAANEKIERRTPYMKEWGDDKSIANTSEEATAIWLQVKSNEMKNTYMKSILEKYITQQKGKEEKEKNESDLTLSHASDELRFNEVEKSKEENVEESVSHDKMENVSSMETSDAKSEQYQLNQVMIYPSDDSNILIHNEDDSNLTNVSFDVTVDDPTGKKSSSSSSLEELISEKEKKQLTPVVGNQDPNPIWSKTLVYIVERLGLNHKMNSTALSSTSVGFAAGALVMALLQKMRSR